MISRIRHLSMLCALLLVAVAARADVKLPAIISDNMALQQNIAVPIWGTAEPGEEVTVTFAGQTKKAKADDKGKWIVKLDALKANGTPSELVIAGKNSITIKNVIVGEVWVCSGQSNMEWVVKNSLNPAEEAANAKYPLIRHFAVKKAVKPEPSTDLEGKWLEASPENVPGFTAVGYFFGRDLHLATKLPVGLIHTSWGGTPAEAWTSKEALDAKLPEVNPNWAKSMESLPERKKKFEEDLAKYKVNAEKLKAEGKPVPPQPRAPADQNSPHRPSSLYNGMINPILPYAIAGATWYQGESNAGRAMAYRTLLPTMISDWRKAWGQGDFPFLIVQLANYMGRKPEPAESGWAELREAQTMTAFGTFPKAGLALAIDIGEEKDIHPKNKQDVGKRLALAARAIAYGENIPYSGPLYDSMAVEGNKIRIKFKHVNGGLVAKGGDKLTGFSIAGEDKKFVWATAAIDGETIVVTSEKVAAPVAVRYAWADNPECNLYNKADLPAVPFRTDVTPTK